MSRQQSYQNKNKGFFGKVVNRIKTVFTNKKITNKVVQPKQNETRPSPKRIRRRRRTVSIFSCKPKSTPCTIKQATQAKRDHGYLWSGTNKVTV